MPDKYSYCRPTFYVLVQQFLKNGAICCDLRECFWSVVAPVSVSDAKEMCCTTRPMFHNTHDHLCCGIPKDPYSTETISRKHSPREFHHFTDSRHRNTISQTDIGPNNLFLRTTSFEIWSTTCHTGPTGITLRGGISRVDYPLPRDRIRRSSSTETTYY